MSQSEANIVNLEEILENAARKVLGRGYDDVYISVDELKYNGIVMKKHKINNENTVIAAGNTGVTTDTLQVKKHVDNSGNGEPMESSFKFAQSKTTSTAEITLTQGAYFGPEFGVPLTVVKDEDMRRVFGSRITIKQTYQLEKKENTLTLEEKVPVGAGLKKDITVGINFKNYATDFSTTTTFKGPVKAQVVHPKTGRPIWVNIDICAAVMDHLDQLKGVVTLNPDGQSIDVNTKGRVEYRVSVNYEAKVKTL